MVMKIGFERKTKRVDDSLDQFDWKKSLYKLLREHFTENSITRRFHFFPLFSFFWTSNENSPTNRKREKRKPANE
jgi:hypothetical protein